MDFPNATNKFNAIWLFGIWFLSHATSRDFFSCLSKLFWYFLVFCHLCCHSNDCDCYFYGVSPFNYYDHKNCDHVCEIFTLSIQLLQSGYCWLTHIWWFIIHPSHSIINIFRANDKHITSSKKNGVYSEIKYTQQQ